MNDILKQVRLLYIEDDESIRNILSRGIKRRVKELEVAVDGKDGLAKFEEFKPDIIVTDIKMPYMSGLEMSVKIREIDKNIPIIITSAHGEAETLIDAIDKGVNGYVIKPIDKDKLFNTIYIYAKSIVLERELKKKEKELIIKDKNDALLDIIGNIAHQWRQPLSIISTAAGTIKLKKELNILSDDELFRLSTDIEQISQELSLTIDQMKKFINDNSNQEESFNFKKEIDNCVSFVKGISEEKNIHIIIDCDDKYNSIRYKELFSKSILNILFNAIEEFTITDDKNNYIFITLKYINNEYIICIKDNAGGIDNSIIKKIFEPYFTTKHKSQGKGLGLYHVYNIIHTQLNGSITVENTTYKYKDCEYKGSEFKIILKGDNNV